MEGAVAVVPERERWAFRGTWSAIDQPEGLQIAEPITLGPGDRLDLEVTTPGPVTIAGEEEPINSVYQIGVSLCGYASIEA